MRRPTEKVLYDDSCQPCEDVGCAWHEAHTTGTCQQISYVSTLFNELLIFIFITVLYSNTYKMHIFKDLLFAFKLVICVSNSLISGK